MDFAPLSRLEGHKRALSRRPPGKRRGRYKDDDQHLYTNPKTLRARFALGFWGMGHRATQKEKAVRALLAGFDLLDTAEWFAGEVRGALASFDLTMAGFRLMEMLLREGRASMSVAARGRGLQRQNLNVIVASLERRGWVRRTPVRLPPATMRASRLSKARRAQPRKGRPVVVVGLTETGERYIRFVLPRHIKLVKALMRTLDGREQMMLIRLCRKLRQKNILKFISELTHRDEDDEFYEPGVRETAAHFRP
jgi:DNA-binding MarR family transcriptional regulator